MKDCDNTYYTTHDHHLLWMKSKQILSTNKSTSPINASFNPTKHFHEPLVGVMWPPRSYTCSFCKRKFRSAQALGGHMNVHRRDRAKLKQSPNSPQKQPTTRLQRHSSHYQETGIPNLRKYDFPQENESSWNNRSFQDHRPVSSSLDKKVASCQKIMTVKDGKSCKKNVKYSSECSSMEDIDLELRLGHSPTTRM